MGIMAVHLHPVCYVAVTDDNIFKALVNNGLADADRCESRIVSREYFSEILDNLEENGQLPLPYGRGM